MTPKMQAIKLRQEGYSYSYIATKTKLSKSTLSYHLKDVPYEPNEFTLKTIGKARAKSGASKARTKLESQVEARSKALSDISPLSKRDIFMLGIGLYIGEGSKTHGIIRVVNSDEKVINLFIRWLSSFEYPKSNLAIRLHLYPDSNIAEAESYWSRKTGLPLSQFQTACIDRRSQKNRKRSGTHLYGTAHVTSVPLEIKGLGLDSLG